MFTPRNPWRNDAPRVQHASFFASRPHLMSWADDIACSSDAGMPPPGYQQACGYPQPGQAGYYPNQQPMGYGQPAVTTVVVQPVVTRAFGDAPAHTRYTFYPTFTVADPGFDLRGGVDVVNKGGGRKSLKVLKVEVKVILACFGHISIKIMLKINRERRINKENKRFGIKKS